MPEKFIKNRRTGVVTNVGDFQKYTHQRNAVKKLQETKTEINKSQNEISTLKTEMKEIKELLKQLLRAKNN